MRPRPIAIWKAVRPPANWCYLSSSDPFDQRRRAVGAGLAERKLDGLVVAFSPNLRYLTGFTGSNGSLLVLGAKSILFTDPRYRIQAAQEVTCRVKTAKGPLVTEVAAAIARLGLKRIGYDPGRMTCDAYESLKSRLPMRASLEPVKGWIEELRMVKSPAEIACIRLGRNQFPRL